MMTETALRSALPHCLQEVAFPGLVRQANKVRDVFEVREHLLLVATDRLSAFDRVVGVVPFKGQVLTELSSWWFAETSDLVGNHWVGMPDPNVTLVRRADPLPVEVVVRGYITGSTSTSLWTLYRQGVERPYGLDLPPGLRKNEALPRAVLTPTTKGGHGQHDERLTPAEVVGRGLVGRRLWGQVERVALDLFERGSQVAARCGLVLVDSKYEFGLIDGRLALIDEVHTPDSSRYWLQESLEEAGRTGGEPAGLDKEQLRLWLVGRGYRGEGTPPPLPDDLVVEMARRYQMAFERLTGRPFAPAALPARPRVEASVRRAGWVD